MFDNASDRQGYILKKSKYHILHGRADKNTES